MDHVPVVVGCEVHRAWKLDFLPGLRWVVELVAVDERVGEGLDGGEVGVSSGSEKSVASLGSSHASSASTSLVMPFVGVCSTSPAAVSTWRRRCSTGSSAAVMLEASRMSPSIASRAGQKTCNPKPEPGIPEPEIPETRILFGNFG